MAFISAALYAVYMFVPPYVSYYMLKTDVREEAGVAHMYTDKKLVEHIREKAASWSVPLEDENISISRDSEIRIKVSYDVTLEFPGGYTKVLEFRINEEKPLKGRID